VPQTDIRRRAALLDSLAQQLNFVDRREDLVETCSAAVALWHELGDTKREFDSLLSLAGNLWWLCRGADSSQASNELLKLAKSLGPSPQLAKAYRLFGLEVGHGSRGRGPLRRQMRPVSWAHMATSTRFRAPSFRMRLARWALTVLGVM
jgi:hypothetical protein